MALQAALQVSAAVGPHGEGFLMKKWQQWVLVLGLLSFFGLGGYALYSVIINDQLNTEAKAGNVSSMQTLLRQGASIEGRSIHFKTPLMSAAEGGNGNAVLFLLSHGADVNADTGSGSVLMWAVASGNVGVVRILIIRGADVNWRSSSGATALQMAKEYKQPAIANMLQLAGARN